MKFSIPVEETGSHHHSCVKHRLYIEQTSWQSRRHKRNIIAYSRNQYISLLWQLKKGSVSSVWLIVPKRSRVSDCSKLQIKGPFILLLKCSLHTNGSLRRGLWVCGCALWGRRLHYIPVLFIFNRVMWEGERWKAAKMLPTLTNGCTTLRSAL